LLFCLAYGFVFKETVSRRLAGLLFGPVVGLFVLSSINPGNIVFGPGENRRRRTGAERNRRLPGRPRDERGEQQPGI